MVIYWLYKYKVIDRDIGVLSLISLEEAKDVEFPMPSLCLIEPFIDTRFDTDHSNINSTDYIRYLKGNASHNSVETIDYERVTLNLNNYFYSKWRPGKLGRMDTMRQRSENQNEDLQ